MTRANSTTKAGSKTKRAVTSKAKLSTGTRRAVKRSRVQMIKPSPSAPDTTMPVPHFEAPALTAVARPVITPAELETLVRREAFKRAQLRQFRGGSPANDWFAAEAAVKADLTARGVSFAS